MSDEGRSGFWNRAGRRSGGNRPFEIVLPRICPTCGAEGPFEWLVNIKTMVSWERCPKCKQATGRERKR